MKFGTHTGIKYRYRLVSKSSLVHYFYRMLYSNFLWLRNWYFVPVLQIDQSLPPRGCSGRRDSAQLEQAWGSGGGWGGWSSSDTDSWFSVLFSGAGPLTCWQGCALQDQTRGPAGSGQGQQYRYRYSPQYHYITCTIHDTGTSYIPYNTKKDTETRFFNPRFFLGVNPLIHFVQYLSNVLQLETFTVIQIFQVPVPVLPGMYRYRISYTGTGKCKVSPNCAIIWHWLKNNL